MTSVHNNNNIGDVPAGPIQSIDRWRQSIAFSPIHNNDNDDNKIGGGTDLREGELALGEEVPVLGLQLPHARRVARVAATCKLII